jgi:glycerophosphoryl diester phosphodiesterase
MQALQLVAHRGHALEYPENTLPAFTSALQLGIRHLELDVQLSRDRVPVVLHDASLLRTCGVDGLVWDQEAHELLRTAAAETARLGDRHAGTRLPALSDVLALLRGWPDARLFVELKTESIEHFGLDAVLDAVLGELRRQPGPWIPISFDIEAVRAARARSDLPIGWVLTRYDAASAMQAAALAPDFLFCNWRKFPDTGPLWSGPWQWCSYEVRDATLARALHARGVPLIETMAVRTLGDALRAASSTMDSRTPT